MTPEPPSNAARFQRATGATSAQIDDLEAYVDLLAEWSGRMNLIGPSAMQAVWPRHIYDSWQLTAYEPDVRRWADLGSGAGLPGIVLAIFLKATSGSKVYLVESLAKRCRFLEAVVETLGLPAEVRHARAEAGAERVDVVTARAVAPLDRLLDFARPWLGAGGRAVFLKGAGAEAEIEAAKLRWNFDVRCTPSLSDAGGRVIRIDRAVLRG